VHKGVLAFLVHSKKIQRWISLPSLAAARDWDPGLDKNDWIIDCEAHTTVAAMVFGSFKIAPLKDQFTARWRGEFL